MGRSPPALRYLEDCRLSRAGTATDSILQLGLLDDDAIALDAAALQLAALDHPALDLGPYVDLLGGITRRLVALGSGADSAESRALILARVMFAEFGFTGDRDAYEHPDNADLIRVIDRRRGLPVSLSIIYVATARRLGWQADVLNTPGHVLSRIGSETEPVLIDPFDGGAIVEPGRLAALLRNVLGAAGVPTADHLAPMSNRSVLVRLLMNQANRAEAGGDPGRAKELFARMTIVAPSNGQAWWELSRLQLLGGDTAAARASLSAILEVTRDAALRMHVFAALDAIAGGSA